MVDWECATDKTSNLGGSHQIWYHWNLGCLQSHRKVCHRCFQCESDLHVWLENRAMGCRVGRFSWSENAHATIDSRFFQFCRSYLEGCAKRSRDKIDFRRSAILCLRSWVADQSGKNYLWNGLFFACQHRRWAGDPQFLHNYYHVQA